MEIATNRFKHALSRGELQIGLWCTLGSHIAAEIVSGAEGEVEVVLDRAAAIGRAVELAQAGDVVLIAGKGAEQGQEFAERVVPFDDREAAKDALRGAAA